MTDGMYWLRMRCSGIIRSAQVVDKKFRLFYDNGKDRLWDKDWSQLCYTDIVGVYEGPDSRPAGPNVLEILYRLNGEVRLFRASPGTCHRCHAPVLWVEVDDFATVRHSVHPETHESHYGVCPVTVREREIMNLSLKQMGQRTFGVADTVADDQLDTMRLYDGEDGDNGDW